MMYGWTMGVEGWLWMGAWGLVIVLIVWLLVREPRRSTSDDALSTLRGRLARGEISPDEFEQARRLLESSTDPKGASR
jgi:putative membrane protein